MSRPSGVEAAQYGFRWGPLDVTRLAHIEGRGYVLRIITDHQEMQIHVTEKGRKITAYESRSR